MSQLPKPRAPLVEVALDLLDIVLIAAFIVSVFWLGGRVDPAPSASASPPRSFAAAAPCAHAERGR